MAKLYFYYSAMNAGKSTSLLQSSYNYRERGMYTILFTPEIDNRFKRGKIVSRIGVESDATVFSKLDNLFDLVKVELERQPIGCVLVDEAQFLTRWQVEQLSKITIELDVPVLAYGLRTDFRGEPFEGSKYLLAWADNLKEIKAICFCGSKATMVLRLDEHGRVMEQGEQIQIGGNDKYISVCRKHFWRRQQQKAGVG